MLYAFLRGFNVVMISYIIFILGVYPQVHNSKVDPILEPYVNKYFDLVEKHCSGKDIKSKYHEIKIFDTQGKESWIGECRNYISWASIRIDQMWFYGANEEEREQLVYHEMSHCFLGLGHSKDKFHYMYDYHNDLPRHLYTEQLIQDIKNRCD